MMQPKKTLRLFSRNIRNKFLSVLAGASMLLAAPEANAAIVITKAPESQLVPVGGSATFVTEATGDSMEWTWSKYDPDWELYLPMYSETNLFLHIPFLQLKDDATYFLELYERAFGTYEWFMVYLDVVEVSGPDSVTANMGASAEFSVSVTGSNPDHGPLGYQWYHEGDLIPGATTSVLSINPVNLGDAGEYKVKVSNGAGSFEVSATLTVNGEANEPLVKILSPKKNQVFGANVAQVSGTASDDSGIASVLVKVNDADDWTAADLSGTGTAITWSAEVPLTAGTNYVTVKAIDIYGNETELQPLQFYYHVPSTLTIKKRLNGNVIGGEDELNVGEVINNIKSPIGSSNTELFIGRSYQLKATVASSDYILYSWTAKWDGQECEIELSDGLVCKFEMQPNMEIYANYIDNPFTSRAGTYVGVFAQTLENVPVLENFGYIQLKLTEKQRFSAKVWVDGDVISISGTVDRDGWGHGTSRSRLKKTDKPELTLSFQVRLEDEVQAADENENNGEPVDPVEVAFQDITGFLFDDSSIDASVMLTRVAWSKTDVEQQPVDYAGTYTALFSGFQNKENGPVGTGHAVITVSTNQGKVKVAGVASDYHKIKGSTYLARTGVIPYFSTMYPVKRQNQAGRMITETRGFQLGFLYLEKQEETTFVDGLTVWLNKGWTNNIYSNGFHAFAVNGQVWVHDKQNPGATLGGMGFAELTFLEGDLGSGFSNTWRVDQDKSTFKAVKFQKPDVYEYVNGVKASVSLKTGVFKGTFIHPESQEKVKYIGAILQGEQAGEGTFMGPTEGGKVILNAGSEPVSPSSE